MSDVLAVTEHRQGEVRDVSYEIVTAGRELADGRGGDLHLAVINGDADSFAEEVNVEGVDTIHTFSAGDEFNHGVYVQVLEQLYNEIDAGAIVAPHTVNGLDYSPSLSTRLDIPILTDVIGFDADGSLDVIREMYGSKVETKLGVESDEYLLSIRPAEWEQTTGDGSAEIQGFSAEIDESRIGTEVTGFEAAATGDVDLSESEFIVSIGRGIDEEENLDIIKELCDALDADMGASRPLVDNEWLPKNRQVGQSGKTVTPDIYVAIGISGAVQHVAGMKGSDTIIAINTDPNAPIYDIADYGVEMDLFDLVPALTEKAKEAL